MNYQTLHVDEIQASPGRLMECQNALCDSGKPATVVYYDPTRFVYRSIWAGQVTLQTNGVVTCIVCASDGGSS